MWGVKWRDEKAGSEVTWLHLSVLPRSIRTRFACVNHISQCQIESNPFILVVRESYVVVIRDGIRVLQRYSYTKNKNHKPHSNKKEHSWLARVSLCYIEESRKASFIRLEHVSHEFASARIKGDTVNIIIECGSDCEVVRGLSQKRSPGVWFKILRSSPPKCVCCCFSSFPSIKRDRRSKFAIWQWQKNSATSRHITFVVAIIMLELPCLQRSPYQISFELLSPSFTTIVPINKVLPKQIQVEKIEWGNSKIISVNKPLNPDTIGIWWNCVP